MFGYLGNEYSGKQKFNVGRNISNTRGSSSGINCFAPYAPQSLTHNCLQSWSEGNGNQQSGNHGKKSSYAQGSTRVLLLILPQSSAPCSVQSQLKLTVMKYKLYNWNSRENEQWLNDTIWILCPKLIVVFMQYFLSTFLTFLTFLFTSLHKYEFRALKKFCWLLLELVENVFPVKFA